MYEYIPKGVAFLLKKLLLALLCVAMVFAMFGCDFFTTDIAELLSPPSLSGDL